MVQAKRCRALEGVSVSGQAESPSSIVLVIVSVLDCLIAAGQSRAGFRVPRIPLLDALTTGN